ncbi:MAG: cytidine/deoxycytidylate deaminase family protein [Oscillospiraceae bacterium]|jgi:dCMP deaminase|nr:cytidine/deoxycytidylate deaminase family protein [Oscillospiraceae bacterium]
MERKDKINYYLDIAETVLERSTCLRRKYGAIIVLNDEIISTGYNGAPRGRRNCLDLNFCMRDSLNIPSGERYELCRAVHAEANAIISASRRDTIGATLYLAGRNGKTGELLADTTPCTMCRRLIINAGVSDVVCRVGKDEYTRTTIRDWVFSDDSLPDALPLDMESPARAGDLP